MQAYHYKVSLIWMNDLVGWAEAPAIRDPVKFSAPPEFGGEAGLWSPEQLLLFAVGSCFLTTLLALAERSRVPLVAYQAQVEGDLEKISGQGYRFTEIEIRPAVTVEKGSDLPLVQRLLEKAERYCIVRNALAVPVRVTPRVEIVAPAPMG